MNRKSEILQTLSTSIRKARRRAEEQPDVMRHEMYAKSLRMLYDELEELPEDHRLFESFKRSAPRPWRRDNQVPATSQTPQQRSEGDVRQ